MKRLAGEISAYGIAAVAGVLGAGSLALFLAFLWIGGFGIIDLRLSQLELLSWDAALCVVFFGQHSAMIRKWFRVRLNSILPEHCHGVAYTVASSACLLLLVVCWQRSGTELYAAADVGQWVAGAALLFAIAGFVWGIRSLASFDAFGIARFLAGPRGLERPRAALTIKGPYRFIRHPFYAFSMIAVWATPTLSLDRLLLNLLFTGWIILGTTLEERDLVSEFGGAYRDYQHAVPMFIPSGAAWRRRLVAKHS